MQKESSTSIVSLIDYLDTKYPNTTPTTRLTEFEYGIKAGERMLIEGLKFKYKMNEIDTVEEVK